jgi:aspartate/methionine/tyrosine aminotransferase
MGWEMNLAKQEFASATDLRLSEKVGRFTESVIREMTRLALQHGAVNLSQGYPDFPAPEEIKNAAQEAIALDANQYSITWGTKPLRNAIAEKFKATQGIEADPEREVTVCCGSTEAMFCAMVGIMNPGDEVVVFEPFYENYCPDAILSGATQRFVKLRAPDWSFDPDELAAAFGPKTKAIIINSPNNPTGKVFTRKEMEMIRDLCLRWNVIAISDEIYEHMVYDGAEHISIATIDGMRDRTITINALSKTYSVTGWRVGWTIASPALSLAVRKVHDFLTVAAATPLQHAGVIALQLPDSYYTKLQQDYDVRRKRLLGILSEAGFGCFKPYGAYYLMADISSFGFPDDVTFARYLVEKIGVAAVPGSSFFINPRDGRNHLRFTYCKKEETLRTAEERLAKLKVAARP